jgi:hypothetical protein
VRLLRVAPARQTVLDLRVEAEPVAAAAESGWWRLPEAVRAEVIVVLARMIARGVLVDAPTPGEPAPPAAQRVGIGSGRGEGR